jgi:hypothetical protein
MLFRTTHQGRHRLEDARPRIRTLVAVLAVVGAGLTGMLTAATAHAQSQASFTAVDETVDGTGHCLNGNAANPVNCNIYDAAQYVWLNAGSTSAALGAGDYFFAVLAPSGQPDPTDGSPGLLSTDPQSNRTFSVDGTGAISYTGTHDYDGVENKIRLAPFADTPNAGGVYILAICALPFDGSSGCKYDAFKVGITATAQPPTVFKDAAGAYTDTFTWGITKSVDKTLVKQVGGSATFTYTVGVSHDAGTVSGVTVTGTITVTNPNTDGDGNPVAISGVDVTDQLSDGTACTVTGGSDATLTGFDTSFGYSCALAALPQGDLDNTVTVTWPEQTLDNGAVLAASGDSPATFTFDGIAFSATLVDACAAVTDTYAGTLGTVCSTDPSPTDFTYQRTIAVPAFGCVNYPNTATFTADDSGATGSAGQSVTVCGPLDTGARTIGFWSNKNGQGVITGQAKSGTCPAATWLRQYAPFQDLSATATCSQVAKWVAGVIAVANASGASMNAMLKAQMLATALDVYYTGDGQYAGAQKFLPAVPIGPQLIDLTSIPGASDLFGADSLTVSQVLAAAASQSNLGGSVWYANVKSTQEIAKDLFDAINNEQVFGG